VSYSPQTQVVYQHVIKPPSNGMAVASLVIGIVAIVFGIWSPIPFIGLFFAFLGGLPALLAVILGHVGFSASKRVGVGRGNSLAGLVMGYVTIGIIALTTLAWIALGTSASMQ
jgi:uncharacterized membrane protein